MTQAAAPDPVILLLGVAGLLAFSGGVAALIGGLRRWRRERKAAATHLPAIGQIVERYLPPGSAPHPDPVRYVVDFTTPDDRAVRFVTDSIGLMPKNVGQSVNVLYLAADPQQAIVRGGERAAAILLAIGGCVLSVFGLLLALSALDQMMRR